MKIEQNTCHLEGIELNTTRLEKIEHDISQLEERAELVSAA